jgi:RHS Repeat
LRWTYDALGRLKSIPGMVALQSYEADGQTKAITYANGVSTTFTYDLSRHWLTRITTKNAANAALIDNAYSRAANGRIYAINGLAVGDTWQYAYDDLALRQAQEPDPGLCAGRFNNLGNLRLRRGRQHAQPHPHARNLHLPGGNVGAAAHANLRRRASVQLRLQRQSDRRRAEDARLER